MDGIASRRTQAGMRSEENADWRCSSDSWQLGAAYCRRRNGGLKVEV